MKYILPLLVGLCAVLLGAGCPGNGELTSDGPIAAGGEPVRRIAVWPAKNQALNWDADPEPDGLHVPIFLWGDGPLPVHRLGTLECVLYRIDPQDATRRIELYRWEFGPERMHQLVRRNQRNWPFYPLALDWKDKVPNVGRVLLRVRFIDPVTGPISGKEIPFTVTQTAPRSG